MALLGGCAVLACDWGGAPCRVPALRLTVFLLHPQVNDFLSGRSPLTLALRVGDHMMFVQLQLAAQQSSGQLQHRHVIASRGEAGATNSPHCRTLHGSAGSGFARIPVVPACPQSPAPSPTPATPAPPVYCNAPHPAPVTAGMFRSHGASAQTVNSSVVSSCSEVSWGRGSMWAAGALRGLKVPFKVPVPTALRASAARPLLPNLEVSPGSGGAGWGLGAEGCAEGCADPVFPHPSLQVDCSMRGGSSPSSSPAPSARSRKPGAVIESFVNHAPGVFSGTFSGTCS